MFRNYRSYYKNILHLAFPLMLSQAGQVVVQLADSVMVGHVGTPELAAASFASNLFYLVMMLGMGITFGLTPLVGQSYGRNQFREVAIYFKNSLWLNFAFTVVLTSASWGVSYLMPYMGQPREVVVLAIPYFRVLTISMLPFLLFFTFKQFAEGLGNTHIAMVVTLSVNILNIILNYLLIFGKLGFPAMGLLGAGYATLVARMAMPVMMALLLYFKGNFRKYLLFFPTVQPGLKKMLELLKIGFPIGVQLVLEIVAFNFGGVMMGWLGAVPLAAHQVALGMATMTFMISNGIAMATTVRVSNWMGAHRLKEMRKAIEASRHLVLLFMGFSAIVFIVFRNILPVMFTPDKAVIHQAAILLVVAAFFQIFDGLQVVSLGCLRGMADVKYPMYMAGISYLLIGIPISYLFAFVLKFGAVGIWIGFLAGLASAAISFYLRIRYNIRHIEK